MTGAVSRIVRNVTNTPLQVDVPAGATSVKVRYVDSGVAGPLRMCFESASAVDATHRLTMPGAHMVIASRQIIPDLSFSGAPKIYVRTDSAISAGSNLLTLLFGVS